MLRKIINSRSTKDDTDTILLRIISLIAGVFAFIIIFLMGLTAQSNNSYLVAEGILFPSIYLSIFVLTYVSNYVKSKASIILYTIYYTSTIAVLFSFYTSNFSEIQVKILLLVTFAVILGMRKISHLVTYIILILSAITFIFFVTKNNVGDKSTTFTIFIMFFLLSYVNLRSKLATEKALVTAEKNINQMAYYDALTGLPNRYKLNIFVSDLIHKTTKSDKAFAVVFIDLDNFKNINDSLGHSFGDRTLIKTAKILSDCVRTGDIVSRYGGDEFIIILNNIDEQESILITNKIINELNKPILIEGHEVYTTASIGISFSHIKGITVETLISNADAAMYKAKLNGKNTFCFFDENLNKQ